MLDMRKSGKAFPHKALKRIGISLLHLHEHGIIHGDFGTHNIGKFGSRWKLLGVGGSVPIGAATDADRGFYHPPESIAVENKRASIGTIGKKTFVAHPVSIIAHPTYDIWAYGVVVYEAIAGVPLAPYACRGKRPMTVNEVGKIGNWDEYSLRKALKQISDDDVARDLLRHLLHPDPEVRVSSMRMVLEHPFFTGGNLPNNPDSNDAMSPHTISSSASTSSRARSSMSTSRSNTTRTSGKGHSGFPSRSYAHNSDPPAVRTSNSMESIENRENNRGSFAARLHSLKRVSDQSSVADDDRSVRSGRSTGSGFFKFRPSLRRQNAN
jgi:serine/threonine protein kinase